MNWVKLSKDYPKAMTHLGLTFECLYTIGSQRQGVCIKHCKKRDLYDFFDENEIYVEIQCNETFNMFEPHIRCRSDYWFNRPLCDNRSQAETAAFTWAFHILNDRL